MKEIKISNNDIGIAGEFYIAYMLAKHGFKVNVSLGRTEGFDLFVKNPSGTNLNMSVKTTYSSKSKRIMMNEKAETLIDDYLYYAFVRLNMLDGVPEFWIIPSKVVAKVIKISHEIWWNTRKRNGIPYQDTKSRRLELRGNIRFPEDWEKQLEHFKSNIKSLEELE